MPVLYVPRGTDPKTTRHAIMLSELQQLTSLTGERRRGHWICIHSRSLRKMLGGHHYHNVIEELKADGLIEENSSYCPKRNSKSYRLASRYRGPATTPYYAENPTLACAGPRLRLKSSDSVGHRLAEMLDRVAVPDSLRLQGWAGYTLATVRERRYYATRCEFGRMHTSITCLPSAARGSLRLEGSETAELDIASSQPTLLAAVVTTNTTTTHPHTTCVSPTYTICGALDLQDYRQCCESGTLYETLLAEANRRSIKLWDCLPPGTKHRYASNRSLARSDIKKQFLVMLFAPNTTMQRMPLFHIVSDLWPSLAKLLLKAKETEHQAVAAMLQRKESAIMIDGVAAELAQSIPLLTVHDSIIVRQPDADFARKCILRHWENAGLRVTVKSKSD